MKEVERFFGKTREELQQAGRGDGTIAAVGWAVWREAMVSQVWIAESLNLKSAARASQRIRRFSKVEDRDLTGRIRKWKKSRNVAWSRSVQKPDRLLQ